MSMQALLDAIARAAPGPDAQRLFHGRGGRFPGCEDWALDWYPPVWVLTRFGEATDEEAQAVGAALSDRQAQIAPGQPLNWVFQRRQPDGPVSRPVTTLMAGDVPDPHVVTEDGARYRVQVGRGAAHGRLEGRRSGA